MYTYQDETVKATKVLKIGTVAAKSHSLGLQEYEPLIVAMDSMIRYAKAYEKRFEGKLADDGYLGEEWLNVAKGIRNLLNGDGAVAMERGITTDSKNNGCVESMFWSAMEIAGFKEEDL